MAREMPNLKLKGYAINDITQALGACAIAAYVLGYLVLAYNLSTFGFNTVSPFRPRILETGICISVFFATPILIAYSVASISSRDVPKAFALLMRSLCLPILCAVISGLPGFTRDLPSSPSFYFFHLSHRAGIVALCLIPLLAAGVIWFLPKMLRWVWHNYHTKKLLSVLILCPISAIFAVSEIGSTSTIAERRTFLWLLFFSFVTCILIGSNGEKAEQNWRDKQIREVKQQEKELDRILLELRGEKLEMAPPEIDPTELEATAKNLKDRIAEIVADYESVVSPLRARGFINTFGPLVAVGYCIFAIAVYASWLFPYIPIKLGGGEIVAVTIYQMDADRSLRAIHGGMLDQSDEGFFILPSGHDKGLFIPKENVEAIYFANGPSDLVKTIQ